MSENRFIEILIRANLRLFVDQLAVTHLYLNDQSRGIGGVGSRSSNIF